MTWQNKVVWSEGMFLKPQHFQQQERYFEFLMHMRSLPLEGFFWGFHQLTFDEQALALGKIVITSAQGIFQDGTPFHFPAQGIGPRPLDIPSGTQNQRVVLALPVKRQGMDDVSFEDTADSMARYRVTETKIQDINSIRGKALLMQVCDLRPQLLLESDLTDGWLALGVVHVVERRPDNQIILDKNYIPPFLSSGRQEVLHGYLNEISGLLHQCGDALATRLSQPGRGGAAEVADFLMLELLNRWEPTIKHIAHIGTAHPERLYGMLLQLAGDLSTFNPKKRRPADYPDYDHDNLQHCFGQLIAALRQLPLMLPEQHATQIELHDRNHGFRIAIMPSAELVKSAHFILAVHAAMPAEAIRSHFPNQVKISPVETIRALVGSHMPGVELRPLPVAPRQIPYNAGYQYFELDTTHELWQQLSHSSGLAIHIAGDFPKLQLELWAVR